MTGPLGRDVAFARAAASDCELRHSGMVNQVVARFIDGRLIKGTSMDVDPAKPACHIRTPDGAIYTVELIELKALFFVKSLSGDAKHNEEMELQAADRRQFGSALLELTFADGERMVGLTNRASPNGNYFFVLPVDSRSNNIRVLVNRAALKSIATPLHFVTDV
jgi:hypothetical protein